MTYPYDPNGLQSPIFPKTNLSPPPAGFDATKFVQASDWNAFGQALEDIRAAIRAGLYFGLAPQSSDPAPSGITTYVWLDNANTLHLKVGSADFILSEGTAANLTGNTTLTRQRVVNVLANGADVTITLPLAVSAGTQPLLIRRDDASTHNVIVQRQGSDTVAGGTSITLTSSDPSAVLAGDQATAWRKFGSGGGDPALGGDLSGTASAATVDGIQGRAVAATAPIPAAAYVWDGSQWVPSFHASGGENLAFKAHVSTGPFATGATPDLFSAVRISGFTGGAISIALADNGSAAAGRFIGVYAGLSPNRVITRGRTQVRLAASLATPTPGTPLYLGLSGEVTTTKPTSPAVVRLIGYVVDASAYNPAQVSLIEAWIQPEVDESQLTVTGSGDATSIQGVPVSATDGAEGQQLTRRGSQYVWEDGAPSNQGQPLTPITFNPSGNIDAVTYATWVNITSGTVDIPYEGDYFVALQVSGYPASAGGAQGGYRLSFTGPSSVLVGHGAGAPTPDVLRNDWALQFQQAIGVRSNGS